MKPTYHSIKVNNVKIGIYQVGNTAYIPRQAILNSCMRNAIITTRLNGLVGEEFVVKSKNVIGVQYMNPKVKLVTLETALNLAHTCKDDYAFNRNARIRFENLYSELVTFKDKYLEQVVVVAPTSSVVSVSPVNAMFNPSMKGIEKKDDIEHLSELIESKMDIKVSPTAKELLTQLVSKHGLLPLAIELKDAMDSFSVVDPSVEFVKHVDAMLESQK